MSDVVREAMAKVGQIADRKFGLPSEPIRCECGEEFLFWATFAEHLPVCPAKAMAKP